MRFILSLLLFIISLNGFSQSKINWMTWEEAVEASKKEPRKVFVDVYTDWCGWCKKMDATTFVHPVIANYMNENYYAIKFDAETKQEITLGGKTYKSSNPEKLRASHELAQELLRGKMSYPTVVLLDEKFVSLSPVPGFQSAKNLEPMLKFIASNKYKSVNWEEFTKSFKGQVN